MYPEDNLSNESVIRKLERFRVRNIPVDTRTCSETKCDVFIGMMHDLRGCVFLFEPIDGHPEWWRCIAEGWQWHDSWLEPACVLP